MYARKNKHVFSILLSLLIVTGLIITPVSAQTAPTVSDFTKSGTKNEIIHFTAEDFSTHFTDTNTPAETLKKIQISELPEATAGTLKVNDTALSQNQEILVENLDNLTFAPTEDWVGTTSFKWKGSNGTSYSETDATVSITVSDEEGDEEETNQPPVVEDLNITTEKNTPVTQTLPATDPEEEPLIFEIITEPEKGTVVLSDTESGTFTYTPNTDEIGEDSFQFKANDGNSDSNIGTVTIAITEPAPPQPNFIYADLAEHWANYSAGKLADRNIIIGEKIADKYFFYPDKIMNRAEFNLFLNAAMNIDSDSLGVEPVGYADEDEIPYWVVHEARAAKREGLINGSLENGNFYYHAFNKLTRIEAAVILHHSLKPDANNDDPLEFTDIDSIPEWGIPYLKNMRGYGIIKGYDDGSFRPHETISRAQAAEMLYQVIKYREAHQ